MTVDEFVKRRVQPEHQAIVAMIRQLMRDMAPKAEELISYGMPVYRAKRIFAWISPGKKDITLAFSRGAQFEDKYGLLQGVAKTSRHVKLTNLDDVNKAALKYYIRQALKLDRK